MQKVTVIIPTLMRSFTFDVLLEMLERSPSVKEVIVIDNSPGKSFDHITTKIKAIQEPVDMFVNPAWNEGVRRCHTDYYLLMNDDVICDDNPIRLCAEMLEDDSVDVVISRTQEDSIGEYMGRFVSDDVEFIKSPFDKQLLSGCFIMGRKQDWVPIPETIKVFYGDNWIFDQAVFRRGKRIALLYSDFICHYRSTTIKAEGTYKTPIFDQEGLEYLKLRKAML